MSWMYGDDYAYAATRLDGTVVTHNSKPFYVHAIKPDGTAVGHYLYEDEGSHTIMAKELELVPVKLGYVNMGNNASYIARKPMRRDWRQGLRPDNMVSIDNRANVFELKHKDLANTIMNIYPALKDVIKAENNPFMPRGLRAWHRHWAVDGQGMVHYKGEKVGQIVNGSPMLMDNFNYLREALEESL